VVFEEMGKTVDTLKTLPEVLGILSGIVTGTFSFVKLYHSSVESHFDGVQLCNCFDGWVGYTVM
jgi:hypothetical protein